MTRTTSQVGEAGKYDAIAERLSLDLKAAGVVLIVIDGRHGSGLSVSINPAKPHARELSSGGLLAQALRAAADQIDAGGAWTGTRITVVADGEQS